MSPGRWRKASAGTARRRSGARRNSVLMAIWPSKSRQRGAQRSARPARTTNAGWERVDSSSSGWSNWRSSRLADPITPNTISPRGIVTPANVTSSSVSRSVASCTGES